MWIRSAPQVLAGLRNLVGAFHTAGRTKIASSLRWVHVTPPEPWTSSVNRHDQPERPLHDFAYRPDFTPTSSSWLNLVERWFREITDKAIRRDVFHSVDELTLSRTT
jgi:hypothetical protein